MTQYICNDSLYFNGLISEKIIPCPFLEIRYNSKMDASHEVFKPDYAIRIFFF